MFFLWKRKKKLEAQKKKILRAQKKNSMAYFFGVLLHLLVLSYFNICIFFSRFINIFQNILFV